jgi:hypothetical protein
MHTGRISHPDLQPDGQLLVAPSAINPKGQAWTEDAYSNEDEDEQLSHLIGIVRALTQELLNQTKLNG